MQNHEGYELTVSDIEELVASSDLFDEKWYRKTYLKGNKNINCVTHYLNQKGPIRRSPSLKFDASVYIRMYPDVFEENFDPLVHFILYGKEEGRLMYEVSQSSLDMSMRKDEKSSEVNSLDALELVRTSSLFDAGWYKAEYPPVDYDYKDAALHYLEHGYTGDFDPSPLFSGSRYLKDYSDVENAKFNPLVHYILTGRSETRRYFPVGYHNIGYSDFAKNIVSDKKNYALSENPLVSFIVTNKNGAWYLKNLFESLKHQTYHNFEIILVDDGSDDGSLEVCSQYPNVKAVRGSLAGEQSAGFAKGNNIGLQHCSGELILLQNNDTWVDQNFLERLVRRIQSDSHIGAVCPKIRFWSQFHRVTLKSQSEFTLNIQKLYDQLEYKKIFVRSGEQVAGGGAVTSISRNGMNEITFDLPVEQASVDLHVKNSGEISVHSSDNRAIFTWRDPGKKSIISVGLEKFPRFYVVNNAGGVELGECEPADRGFGDVDRGQFDGVEDVPYFCGCSVLIRRDALLGMQLFPAGFVAYYEDSDLSLRIRRNGFRITYDGSSIVYHRHSASNVEFSGFWRKHTFRNKFLFKYANLPERRAELHRAMYFDLNHMLTHYGSQKNLSKGEKEFASAGFAIYDDAVAKFAEIEANRHIGPSGRRIAVYNPYWTTMGGGEAHALLVGEALKRFGDVELISHSDFDLDYLCSYFGVNADRFRKRIVRDMSYEITCEYDIFVNSCYGSHHVSGAAKSYYIVSFPFRLGPTREFLNSYQFLANSEYTYSWMERYWGKGNFKGTVLYPAVSESYFHDGADWSHKKKTIVSVGRFASSGHTKNQIEIVRAFKMAYNDPRFPKGEWELLLIGSTNDNHYVGQVTEMAAGLPCKIITNASFDEVVEHTKAATIYVHASGIGRNKSLEPELFEHFGMTVAQAGAAGAIPVVYSEAGPKEIISRIGGFGYKNISGLSDILLELLLTQDSKLKDIMRRVSGASNIFSISGLQANVERAVYESHGNEGYK